MVAELLVNPDGALTGANDSARELFGIGPDDMAQSLGGLRPAFEPMELEAHVGRALAERVSHRVGLMRYETRDGDRLDLEVWVLPIFTEHEVIFGAAVTFADVGSTVQLRESFRHVHEELETAYEELQSTNEELVTSNEELQSSYEELETSNEELQSSNEELETTNEELRSSNEELETTYLELKSTSDAVGRLNESLVDANLELRRFSSLHHQVMDHFPAAVIVLNAQLLVEEWNLAAAELWGLDEDDRRRGAVLRVGLRPPARADPGIGAGMPQPRCGAVQPRCAGDRSLGSAVHLPRARDPHFGSRARDVGHAGHGEAGSRFVTPPSRHAGAPDFERQADALMRRLEALSERVMSATGDPPSPLVAEMLEELSAAVEELEVSTEEIHGQNEALAEAKKQLDLESARYRELFDLAPDGYLVTDTLGVILESNRAASDMLGTPGHFLNQKPVVVFVDAADRRLVLDHLHDAVSGYHGPVVEFEARFSPPSHESFPASVHLTVGGASGAADPAGPRVRWLLRDVSRRMEAERALTASETRYRLIAESAADVVIATDGASCVTFASPSIRTVFALDPADVEGQSVADFVHPDDRAALWSLQEDALVGRRDRSTVCRFRCGDGQYLPVEARVAPFREPGERSLGLQYALRDVRVRRRPGSPCRRR